MAFEMRVFNVPALGIGISFRLEAVQIIKLVSGTARNAESYGFEATEGFEADKELPSMVSMRDGDDEGDY
jgi:hypothetical protein